MTPVDQLERGRVRPEIQALRALAVSVVVLHHFWPAAAPAGYIGVDVFFVVSGFLITGLLLRDLGGTGRIRFARFYGRRVRRILPSALLVLAATAAATAAFVPEETASRWFRQILTSTVFAENWTLVAESQSAGSGALESTPVEHFWSLSVEEQFYLFWPLVLVAAVWLSLRVWRDRAVLVPVVLGAVTAASFVASLALTAADNNLAYFSTLSRAWEFGVGGLLACLPAVVGRERMRSAVSWIGLVAIVAAVFIATDVEAFPGLLVLLPVLGTAAVIWAGSPAVPWSTVRLAGLRPVLWLGGISYALYLWHWPVVTITPFITGAPSGHVTMLALLALSVALAWATTRWVEDPLRFGTPSRPRVGTRHLLVATGALGMVLIAGSGASAIEDDPPARLACRSE